MSIFMADDSTAKRQRKYKKRNLEKGFVKTSVIVPESGVDTIRWHAKVLREAEQEKIKKRNEYYDKIKTNN